MLTKARSLNDAKEDDNPNKHMDLAFSAPSSVIGGEVMRASRLKFTPPYLKERLETGTPLPEVHVAVEEVGDNIVVGERDHDVLQKVVQYVIAYMPKELFMELNSLVLL